MRIVSDWFWRLSSVIRVREIQTTIIMIIKSACSIIIFSLTVVLASCGGERPPRWEEAATAKYERPSQPPIPATDHLVVYLDTSASMAGYVSPNGKVAFGASPDGSVFSKTLVELRDVVTTLNPEPKVAIRRVDSGVSAPSFGDLGLSQASSNRGLYNGKETNLAGAIKAFSDPLERDSDPPAPPRFHILVTDGVQSSSQSNTENSCAQGSDAFCVKKRLKELMDSGWGGTVLGLRSEFQGSVYSELNGGKPVPYSSSKKDPNTYRPFFLYVFSPDRAGLDKLIDTLKQKLLPVAGEGNLREYALTSDYSDSVPVIEIPPTEKQTRSLLDVRQEKVKDGDIPRLIVKSSLSTADSGKQQFVLHVKPAWTSHAKAGGSLDELGKIIKWELINVSPEKEKENKRYPVFNLVKEEVNNGIIGLTFETGWIKAPGETGWRRYRLIGKLDVEKTGPPWVSAWSTKTDISAETANKTLNLETSLANLWNNAAMQNYPVAEVWFSLGPK